MFLAASVLSAGLAQAAVPPPVSTTPPPKTVSQEKGDDWFAEIDDMIQDRVVPAPLIEPTNPPVRVEPDPLRTTPSGLSDVPLESASGAYPVERPLVRKQVAQLKPTPTPLPQAMPAPVQPSVSAKTIDSSIIEEILRSDYWLEDEPAKAPETVGPAVTDGRKAAAPVIAEVEAEAEIALPSVTAEDQLLLLEQELLLDLSIPAGTGEVADADSGPAPAVAGAEEVTPAAEESPGDEGGGSMTLLEEELLAELDDFGVEAAPGVEEPPASEPSSEPELSRVDEEADLLIEQLAQETTVEPEPPVQEVIMPPEAPEVDAALAHAEMQVVEPAQPSDREGILFSRAELLQVRMEEAVRRGDREALASLTAELAALLNVEESAEKRPAEAAEPERTMMVADEGSMAPSSEPMMAQTVAPREPTPSVRHADTMETASAPADETKGKEPRATASVLASPDRHMKRFAKETSDERSGRATTVSSVELVEPARTAEQPSLPRAVERTIIVMDAEHQQAPLKEKEAPAVVSITARAEAKPTVPEQRVIRIEPRGVQQAALPQSDAASTEPERKRAVGAPIPDPARLGRVDPVVFLRTPPSSEARRASAQPDERADASARHVSVAVPAAPSVDDWDAPVPFE